MSSRSSKNSTKKDTQKIYYQKNRERIYAVHQAYIRNHSEERKTYLKDYWANPVNQQKRRDYYQKNRDRIRERDKAHYHKTKVRHSEVYRCRKYGISVEQYRELVARLVCDICGKLETIKNKGLSIDHDHKTNKVRGVLCGRCNKALGYIQDNHKLLKKVKSYLENAKNKSA